MRPFRLTLPRAGSRRPTADRSVAPRRRAPPARHVLFIVTAAALASLVALSLAFTAAARPSPLVAIPITLESGQHWPSRTCRSRRCHLTRARSSTWSRRPTARDSSFAATCRRRSSKSCPAAQGASSPFFSPDGTRLGFFRQGAIRAVDARGRKDDTIVEVSAPFGASWRSNGDLSSRATFAAASR